jgi:hypothetical protein
MKFDLASPALSSRVAISTRVPLTVPSRRLRTIIAASLAVCLACGDSGRSTVDSAAGAIAANYRAALAVIDIDMGRHIDAEKKISDKTDDFARSDTIYASVHTSGTATGAAVVGRWTYQDDTVVDEKTDSVTTDGDARTVFYISRPGGLPAGRYTLHVFIDGKEVRAKEVTVE